MPSLLELESFSAGCMEAALYLFSSYVSIVADAASHQHCPAMCINLGIEEVYKLFNIRGQHAISSGVSIHLLQQMLWVHPCSACNVEFGGSD